MADSSGANDISEDARLLGMDDSMASRQRVHAAQLAAGANFPRPPPLYPAFDEAGRARALAERAAHELNRQLHDAAAAGDVVKLREAIAAGADVEARMRFYPLGHFSGTPLCSVVSADRVHADRAEKGRTACVRALLDAGASASAAVVFSHHIQEMPAFAALHDAAGMGLDTISRLLLDAGADLNAGVEMDSRMTPLNVAAEDSRHRLVVLFLSRGATTDGCAEDLQEFSPGYLSRIARAGSFANYQKQQRAKLMAMLAPKFSHLLPPKLTSHVITFWAILGGNSCRRVILCDSKALGACSLCSFVVVLGLVGGARGGDTALRPSHRRRADSTS